MTQGSWPWVTWANTQMCEGLTTSNWWLMGDELHSASVWRSIPLGQYSRFVYKEKQRQTNWVSDIYTSFTILWIRKGIYTWSAPVRWMKLSNTDALNLSITSMASSSSPWKIEEDRTNVYESTVSFCYKYSVFWHLFCYPSATTKCTVSIN